MGNLGALEAELSETLQTRTADEWISALLEAGVPTTPILTYREALASKQSIVRSVVEWSESDRAGRTHPADLDAPSSTTTKKTRRCDDS
jgi:crotonobetainyl-CoA:carnitine CoA-transferase CaiB-like acyl-CoA transferase